MILSDFLHWMETASPASKAEAIRNLCRYYLVADTDEETRGVIETALTVVLDDPDPEVRFAMADILGASPRAPRHIIFGLAADKADIAVLVLARSPVFIDVELTEIAAAAETLLQVAIARRQRLSSTVAATIAEVGEKPACAALLANPTASIARLSFRRIAERFGGDADMREALFSRHDLPADVRQLLIRAIGNALGSLAIVRQWLPEARARTITRDACDRATIAIAAETETHELPALVEHLRATEQLTTALLLRAVCAGNVAFFETAVAMLARLPAERVATLVRGGRLSGLRAAYGKAGLPAMAFDAFAAALDAWRKVEAEAGPVDRYRFTMQTVNTVLARYADITDGEANELAAMLRRFAADQAREAARDAARDHTLYLIEPEDEADETWAEAPVEEEWAEEAVAGIDSAPTEDIEDEVAEPEVAELSEPAESETEEAGDDADALPEPEDEIAESDEAEPADPEPEHLESVADEAAGVEPLADDPVAESDDDTEAEDAGVETEDTEEAPVAESDDDFAEGEIVREAEVVELVAASEPESAEAEPEPAEPEIETAEAA